MSAVTWTAQIKKKLQLCATHFAGAYFGSFLGVLDIPKSLGTVKQ